MKKINYLEKKEKKITSLEKTDPIVNVLIMATNEEDTITTTLNSIKDYFDNLIFFHNGSTDKTLDIVKNFMCAPAVKNTKLHIGEGFFTDFAESRNRSIDFAEKIEGDFIIMLDAGDEFVLETYPQNKKKKISNRKMLRKMLSGLDSNQESKDKVAFIIKKIWREKDMRDVEMFDVKMFRRGRNFKYTGGVHEIPDSKLVPGDKIITCHGMFHIYQDRSKYSKKSYDRINWDIETLKKHIEKDPSNIRWTTYLAQTYASNGDFKNAYNYFKKSTELIEKDSKEEFKTRSLGSIGAQSRLDPAKAGSDRKNSYVNNKASNYMKAGLSLKEFDPLNISEIEFWLTKAHNVDINDMEVLIHNIIYYMDRQDWNKAYEYSSKSLKLKYPEFPNEVVVRSYYTYSRYHLNSVICSQLGKYDEAMISCKMAVKAGNKEIDIINLSLLEQIMKEKS